MTKIDALVPHPVHAVVLLFPIDDALEAVKKEEDAKTYEVDPTVFWMKQTVWLPRFYMCFLGCTHDKIDR